MNTDQRTPARPKSRFMRFLTICAVLFLVPIFVLGATVAATGTVTVKVQEKTADGLNLYIPMPALLFDLAMFAVPAVLPKDELREIRREMAPFRADLERLAAEIENIPSGVLVEVQDGDEHVLISKQGRSFRVEVQSDDTDVTVAVPARFLSRAMNTI